MICADLPKYRRRSLRRGPTNFIAARSSYVWTRKSLAQCCTWGSFNGSIITAGYGICRDMTEYSNFRPYNREIECQFQSEIRRRAGARGQAIQPSKPLLPALVESHLPEWESRRFSRQLYDRLALLAAISKNLQEKASIAFLDYFDLNWLLRHRSRTKIRGSRFPTVTWFVCSFQRVTVSQHMRARSSRRSKCCDSVGSIGSRFYGASNFPPADGSGFPFRPSILTQASTLPRILTKTVTRAANHFIVISLDFATR
jgi:hypothetical protein